MAVRPNKHMLAAAGSSDAQQALVGESGAVLAYDKVPFASGAAVFTLDTSTDLLVLHSIQVATESVFYQHVNPRVPALTLHCCQENMMLRQQICASLNLD